MSLSERVAIVNARVSTGDAKRPWADAVLVEGDRVVSIGSSAEIRKSIPPTTRTIDAKGATVAIVDGRVVFETKSAPNS